MLNDGAYRKIFIEKNLLNEECALIFRIYFQLFEYKKLCEIKSDKEFLDKTCDYFIENNEGKVGNYKLIFILFYFISFKKGDTILQTIKLFDFSSENIYKVNKIIDGKLSKITPTFYSKICPGTGLVLFLIKDVFEYTALSVVDKKTPIQRIYNFFNYNIQIINSKQNRIENYLKKYE
jgi:hypothetical protein